ncbi:hypothetical protein [Nocardia africana]
MTTIRDHRDPEWPQLRTVTRLRDIHPLDRPRPPGRRVAVHLHRQLHPGRHSGASIRMAKRSLNAIEAMELQPGYIFEQGLTRELSAHPDSVEARRATLEQREATYTEV